MTLPHPGQSVHMLSRLGVLRVLLSMRWKEGRNVHELAFYTTDDLRRLYQSEPGEMIRLRDGIVDRVQLAAVIRWRVWCASSAWLFLAALSLAAALFAFLAWRFPLPPPK